MLPRPMAFLAVVLLCVFLFFIVTFRNELSDLLNLNSQWSSAVSTEKSITNRSSSGSTRLTNASANDASARIDTTQFTKAVGNTSVVNNTSPEFTNAAIRESNRSTSANHSIPEELLSRGTAVDLSNFAAVSRRRGQFFFAPVDNEFLSDLKLLKRQLSLNYDKNSSCLHVDYPVITNCYGLGSTMGVVTERTMLGMLNNRMVYDSIDALECSWFQRDKTKPCNTMFGDCYFPALTGRQENNENGTCYDVEWFKQKYGLRRFFSSQMSWVSTDVATETEPCIALHIRRGDACINKERTCFDYDDYWKASKLFVDLYPELQRIVVVTDGDDFPLERFQSLVKEVTYTSEVNRSKYNVYHLRNESYTKWLPELREDLENATSELLAEVSEASRCTAFVGTFTAGVSRWIFNNMMTRQGKLPLFYSIDGCLRTAFTPTSYTNRKCEPKFLSWYNW
jgi:hypothetical protein